MRKRVIIVGSGLGGLACGAILARNGYAVTILEQHHQIGGCLQCFSRKGAKFETGMHFIGSADKGQTLHKLMRYLGIEGSVELSELDPTGYDVVSLNGQTYKFAKGRERFIEQMAAYFPHQRPNLHAYYDLIEQIANASSLHSLKYADSTSMLSPEYQIRSINDVIDQLITDPTLASVLVGNLPLYAAEKDKTPFSVHAFIMDFYNQSAYRVVGGSDLVASALANSIRQLGGEILTRHKVVRIVCDDSRATHVELENGQQLECDYVVSDAHPKRTLEWLDTKMIRPAFRQRINNIPQTVGGFSLYLRFKDNAVPYMNYNFYNFEGFTPWHCEHYDEASWPKGYLYMHMCHEQQPRYAKSGVVLSYMNAQDVAQWKDTTVEHRGSDYLRFKHEKAEALLNALSKQFPDIRNCIDSYYTATPLTYRDYTGTEDGGMYGVAKDVANTAACRISQRTKVPNVYQTGQNINSHGMLGVLVGAIVTCSEFVPAATIFQQIIDANE